MDLIAGFPSRMTWSFRPNPILNSMAEQRAFNFGTPMYYRCDISCRISFRTNRFSCNLFSDPFGCIPKGSFISSAKKKNSQSEPILDPSQVEEVYMEDDGLEEEDDDEGLFDDFEDEEIDGDDYLEDEYIEEESRVGDGSGGGGVSLAGTSWDRKALSIAEEVVASFDGEIGVYAFKTLVNGSIQVRIERLTNKSGSPTMKDIEDFSSAYKARLDEAAVQKSVPDDIFLEVSSPGVERVVQVPEDLERFKDRALYVKYSSGVTESGATSENEGIFKLISVDHEANSCTWGLADVRINREKAGKGRPLSKKQREWRLETSFSSLLLVRFYSEI
ncbi:OLC1v1016598C4 [Oldenlandia corymbosa var. corymbosa]|nr:OLC1v1016598C4 [Oldenlandia corymbosa var. corymbosa]